MKNVYILIYEDVVLSSAAAPLDIFMRTNDILRQMGQAAPFHVSLVAQQASAIQAGSPASFACQRSLDEVPPKSDGHYQNLILVPAFEGEWEELRKKTARRLRG